MYCIGYRRTINKYKRDHTQTYIYIYILTHKMPEVRVLARAKDRYARYYNVKTKNWAVVDSDEDRASLVTIYRIYTVYYTDIGA